MPSSRRKRSWWRRRMPGVEPGVVGQRRQALVGQPGGGFLDLLARLAIDDAGVALVLVAQEAQQLAPRIVLLDDGVADVRPVEAADEGLRILQLQPHHDVGAGVGVGGGRQRQPRHAGKTLVQHAQAQVLLAEVVAPLADAVRLVDGKQAEQAALVQRIQHRQETRRQDALRRRVQQHQPPRAQFALDRRRILAVQRAVQEAGMHAQLFQRADLVVHQRDQRRHHHRHAAPGTVPGDGRHLVAQALAAAGGHQHQRVAAADHMLDDRALVAAEGRVAEDLVQDGQRIGGQAHGGRRSENTDCDGWSRWHIAPHRRTPWTLGPPNLPDA